jgi:hypothetical protein
MDSNKYRWLWIDLSRIVKENVEAFECLEELAARMEWAVIPTSDKDKSSTVGGSAEGQLQIYGQKTILDEDIVLPMVEVVVKVPGDVTPSGLSYGLSSRSALPEQLLVPKIDNVSLEHAVCAGEEI